MSLTGVSNRTPPHWLIPWISRTHAVVYKLSKGKVGSHVDGMPCILLRTIGRRSGKPHTVCLTFRLDGGRGVLRRRRSPPGLVPQPASQPRGVIVQERERVSSAVAETLTGEEREALWETRIASAARHARYQERTDREIPLGTAQLLDLHGVEIPPPTSLRPTGEHPMTGPQSSPARTHPPRCR